MKKLYSESEIEFLKSYYPIYGAKFCSKKINRPVESVRNKASSLKIKSGKEIPKEDIIFVDLGIKEKIDSTLFLDLNKITKESAYFIGFF
jgi:hypothetical protein